MLNSSQTEISKIKTRILRREKEMAEKDSF